MNRWCRQDKRVRVTRFMKEKDARQIAGHLFQVSQPLIAILRQ
jgi:hypothetical protein